MHYVTPATKRTMVHTTHEKIKNTLLEDIRKMPIELTFANVYLCKCLLKLLSCGKSLAFAKVGLLKVLSQKSPIISGSFAKNDLQLKGT